MTLQQRVETLATDKLQACAIGLFANADDSAGDALNAVLAELEIRLGDDFAEWADANF